MTALSSGQAVPYVFLIKQQFEVPVSRDHSVGEKTLLRELLNEERSGQSTALRPEDRSAGYSINGTQLDPTVVAQRCVSSESIRRKMFR